jgi:DNA-binding LytR/AlgR family response regulator
MNNKQREQIKKAWDTPDGEQILQDCERAFGKYKKITLTTTGKSYKVPVRDIMTIGIKGVDLVKYPEWKD